MFYVYAWYNKETKEIFYVGKGSRNRYKQIRKRNRLFTQYINTHDCDVKIIKYFEDENDAFKYEEKHIKRLKKKGQCTCNLSDGGHGGVNFVWTDEMRAYKSKYNPMKDKKRRKRMSKNNPMKNKEISAMVGEKNKRKVVINHVIYNGVVDAADDLDVCPNTISLWCKRGYDTYGRPCRYYDENYKDYTYKKSSSKHVIVDKICFDSVKSAARYVGVWPESLIRAIKGNRKCKGYVCKYDDQQPSRKKSVKVLRKVQRLTSEHDKQ